MKSYQITYKSGAAALFGVLAACMAGCAATESVSEQAARDRLAQANTTFTQARQTSGVETYALKNLQDAEKLLKDAEAVRKKTTSPNPMNPAQGYNRSELDAMYDEVAKLAYMADRKAQVAIASAEGIALSNSKMQLSKEKAEVRLQKSTIEKGLLQKDVDAKNSALEKARLDLTNATSEAERTRILAEIQASEILLAKAQSDARALEAQHQAEAAKAELAALMEELSQLQGQLTDRGIVLTIGDVLFATGKANLTASAQNSIDKLAEFMEKHSDRKLLVEGHTDSTGGDELNLKLSEQRAASVKSALEKKGVASERIVTIGYGKKFPVESNETAAGKQKNRRVEVIILNEGVAPESQFRK